MTNNDITMTQIEAGEAAVMRRLRDKGLLPPEQPPTEPRAGMTYCVICNAPFASSDATAECEEHRAPTNPRAQTATRDEPALTRNWNELTRYQQIIARHRIHDVSDIPNDEYAASWQDVKELRDQHTKLVAALRALRNNIDVSTINNSKRSTAKWTELIDLADAALANEPEGEGVR